MPRKLERLSDPDLNSQARAGWLCALLYLAGSLALLLTALFPESRDRMVVVVLGVLGVLLSLAMLRAPWSSWPAWAPATFVVLGFAFLAVAGRHGVLLDVVFLAVLPLPFIYCGLALPPRTALKLAPVGAAAFLIGVGWTGAVALTGLLISLPLSVLVAEALAAATASRNRARGIVAAVLDAAQQLIGSTCEAQVLDTVSGFAREMLHADQTAICDASNAATPLAARNAMETGVAVFVPDVGANDAVAPEAWCGTVGLVTSALFVAIPIPRGAGSALALGWTASRARVCDEEQRSLELILADAAQAIERIRSTSQLAVEAETDPLTNLANRRSFARALERVLPGDAVVLIDVDHFKAVNDRHGHAAGDEVLRAFARHMRAVARKGDCVARYGGDELALILADAGDDGAEAAVARLHQSWLVVQPHTTFSAGIAVNSEGEAPAGTLGRADEALYAAKAAGRNRSKLAVDFRPAARAGESGDLARPRRTRA